MYQLGGPLQKMKKELIQLFVKTNGDLQMFIVLRHFLILVMNYQTVRSEKAIEPYIKKSGSWLEWSDPYQKINQVSSKKTRVEIGEEILTQRISLEEAAQQNPQLLFGYSKLKMDL